MMVENGADGKVRAGSQAGPCDVSGYCLPRAAAFDAFNGFLVPSPERDAASIFS